MNALRSIVKACWDLVREIQFTCILHGVVAAIQPKPRPQPSAIAGMGYRTTRRVETSLVSMMDTTGCTGRTISHSLFCSLRVYGLSAPLD